MLEDAIAAAVTDAMTRAQALSEEKMGALTGGLKIPGLG
jgi:DNA-binding protein YbaB